MSKIKSLANVTESHPFISNYLILTKADVENWTIYGKNLNRNAAVS